MVSLARSSLRYEWRRYLAAVLAVAFSGLLVIVQLGLLLGMFGTVSVIIDRSEAELWASFPDAPTFDLARDIPGRYDIKLRLHPDVTHVEEIVYGDGDWRRHDGVAFTASIIGIEPGAESRALTRVLSPELRTALLEPDAVLVDEAEAEKLGATVGETVSINGRRAKVAGLTSGMRSIGNVYVIASISTARRLADAATRDDHTSFFLVHLRPGADPHRVRDELAPKGNIRPFSLWTADEFSTRSQMYWLLESGTGVGFLFSSLLGFLVGAVITSQTLAGAVMASLREYATLRALGVPVRALRWVIVEQSFWVGVIGLGITLASSMLLYPLAHYFHVGMRLPLAGVTLCCGLTLLVALGAGVLALRSLYRAEPAALLR